jgi:hypothetical protein
MLQRNQPKVCISPHRIVVFVVETDARIDSSSGTARRLPSCGRKGLQPQTQTILSEHYTESYLEPGRQTCSNIPRRDSEKARRFGAGCATATETLQDMPRKIGCGCGQLSWHWGQESQGGKIGPKGRRDWSGNIQKEEEYAYGQWLATITGYSTEIFQGVHPSRSHPSSTGRFRVIDSNRYIVLLDYRLG